MGISGEEGLQAVRAADFAIAQFRFLTRLLLVHGRWDYKRIAKMVLYSFYKNMTFVMTLFWFTIFSGFSGTVRALCLRLFYLFRLSCFLLPLYSPIFSTAAAAAAAKLCVFAFQTLFDSWYISFYNVLFTGVPIIALSIFDKDVEDRSALRYPKLYLDGQRSTEVQSSSFLFVLVLCLCMCFRSIFGLRAGCLLVCVLVLLLRSIPLSDACFLFVSWFFFSPTAVLASDLLGLDSARNVPFADLFLCAVPCLRRPAHRGTKQRHSSDGPKHWPVWLWHDRVLVCHFRGDGCAGSGA